jgi:hypothetical protein
MTPSGTEPFQPMAQCLNQLHHHMPLSLNVPRRNFGQGNGYIEAVEVFLSYQSKCEHSTLTFI